MTRAHGRHKHTHDKERIMPMKLSRGVKFAADEIIDEYERLQDMLRRSRVTSDHTTDEATRLHEQYVQARIERQLIALDNTRVLP